MENVKVILACDGRKTRTVTATWRDAPPPRLTMGVKTELEIRLFDREGEPVDLLAASQANSYRLAFAEDFDPNTTILYSTEGIERQGPGVYRAVLENTRTASMIHALGVSAYRELRAELVAMKSGESWDNPSACLQFPVTIQNRLDTGDTPEPVPGKTYLTTDNVGQFAIRRTAFARAMFDVSDRRPTSVEGTVDKLETLIAALRSVF